ncbi:anibiotic ABC transporter [Rhodococcus triatomae]|uniref:ABC-2 type transport system permease protein n=1 Tax=Rhodococcus triatomae TaxID=300028 RepID=A0A1G8E417_9NOCA|nr:anibiotic ABC transporter [Rhodococcus triatomae]QNG21236.1 anibiotic ABC transporter [Rhodococcus triatomae]QNG25474.1 anibiotic ABC transporter [Rhodococcus triatomae]SDH64379.1 ABC-2 type transport system permease protein [Rhodococcus triatomae]
MQFRGFTVLAELALRSDRFRIPVWALAIAGFTALTASSYATLFPDAAARAARAELVSSPAATALAGPGYGLDDYTLGAMVANEIGAMAMVAAAVMSVLLTTRHLRGEEESGRSELVLAGVVGRFAPIGAGLAASVVANVFVALSLAIGLLVAGVPPGGGVVLAASVFVVGLVFTGTAALLCQFTEHARTAVGVGLGAVALAYLLRAVGDVRAKESGSVLSWLSPIGWGQATRAWVDTRWWPLALGLLVSVGLVGATYVAARSRDLGAGILRPRRGRAEASPRLDGIAALALREQRGILLSWGLGVLALAVPVGALGQQISTFLEQDPTLTTMLPGGVDSAADGAYALYVVFLAILAAMYAAAGVSLVRSEEEAGRAGQTLAGPVARVRWLGEQAAVIACGAVVVVLVAGAGMGITAAATLSDGGAFLRLLGAAANSVPAVLVVTAVAVAVYGWAPRAFPVVWGYLGYVLVVGMFDEVLPGWFAAASPFHHTPALPAADVRVLPLLALFLVAVALTAAGLAGFQRRDLTR